MSCKENKKIKQTPGMFAIHTSDKGLIFQINIRPVQKVYNHVL